MLIQALDTQIRDKIARNPDVVGQFFQKYGYTLKAGDDVTIKFLALGGNVRDTDPVKYEKFVIDSNNLFNNTSTATGSTVDWGNVLNTGISVLGSILGGGSTVNTSTANNTQAAAEAAAASKSNTVMWVVGGAVVLVLIVVMFLVVFKKK